MKRFFSGIAAITGLAFTLTACTNSGDEKAATDSSTTNSTVSTQTNTSTYAAMADSVERNSQQGYYLNPKTGKPYASLKVDRSTGKITTDAGEPVWRYVDNRNWWVYGGNDWGHIGDARMDGSTIMYKGDGDKWIDYDARWKSDDDMMSQEWKDGDSTKVKIEGDGDMKIKDGDTKIKIEKDGDTKVKDNNSKTKTNADGTKKDDQ